MNKLGRILVVLGGIGLLLVSFASATTGIRQQNRATVSPIESTRQQQTIDAVVREILGGTATAQQQFAVTQTVEAAVNNAISQTLAVESALTKQAVMATTSYESTATVEGAKLARITEIFESTGTADAVQIARATANFESTGTAQAVQMARATANFEATAITATYTPTPTPTKTPTVTPTITPTPPFLCRVFVEMGQGSINVRTRPDVNSTRIGTLPVGVAANVLELQRDAGGSIWFNVSATIESSATINGWLRSDTVVQMTACPLVP